MGQYYHIGISTGLKTLVNYRKVKDGDYQGAKLMEHSYFHNELMDAVANFLHGNPARLLWCGDYAGDDEVKEKTSDELCYKDLWGDDPLRDGVNEFVFQKCDNFQYEGHYLVNHDKNQFVSFDRAMKENKCYWAKDLRINPISLLTALGNGRGGGDYGGENEKLVGSWAWDKIEVTDSVPVGYEELEAKFTEQK